MHQIIQIEINDCLFLILLLRIAIYSQMPAIFVLTMIIIIKAQSHEVNKHVNRINITLTELYTEFNHVTNNNK